MFRHVLPLTLIAGMASPLAAAPVQCPGWTPPGPAGGTYSGPGDTSGSGSAGPAATPGAFVTGPVATPGGLGIATGGMCRPMVVTGGCPGAAPAAAVSGPAAAVATAGPATPVFSLNDPTSWETWWAYNREPLLELRASIEQGLVVTGDDDYFIGRGEREPSYQGRPHEGVVRERVVPELLKTLEDATSPFLLSETLLALGRIGAAPAGQDIAAIEDALRGYVSHPNVRVAESAVLSLGILGQPGAVRTLEHIVEGCPQGRDLCGRNSVPRRLRSFGAYALGLAAQRSEHEEARRYAAMSLTAAADRTGEATDLQVACVSALGIDPVAHRTRAGGNAKHRRASSSREAQVDMLLAILDDPRASWQTRAHTVTAVARLSEDASIDVRERVIERLMVAIRVRSKDPEEVCRSALLALGRLGTAGEADSGLRDALVRATRQGPQASRNFALLSLGRVGGRAGSADMGDEPHAGTAAVRKELLKTVARSNGMSRSWAAIGLGLLEREVRDTGGTASDETRQALDQLLAKERSPSNRAALGLALGLYGDPAASASLLEAFDEVRDEATRGSVAIGLGMMGATEAVEAIGETLRESTRQPLLMQECAIALALLGDRSLVPELVEMLEETSDVTSRAAVANALGFVGDQRCVPALLELLDGATNDRIAAVRSLGRVCDGEALPWGTVLASDVNYLAATETLTSAGVGVLDLR